MTLTIFEQLKSLGVYQAKPDKILGRCNQLARRAFFTKAVQDYMVYKELLSEQFAVPQDVRSQAIAMVCEISTELPKSCRRKDGSPTPKGQQRLDAVFQLSGVDVDNAAKPIIDAVFDDGTKISDQKLACLLIFKRWALEPSIRIELYGFGEK